MTDQAADLQALTTEALMYGFALVFNHEQVVRFTQSGMGSLTPAPFNVFAHATPAGEFRPILRMYQPRPEVFDGYEIPAITRSTP